MARCRVYFKLFNHNGTYSDSWTEVTKDVSSLGSISKAIDNTEFDVGVLKNSSLSLTLRNDGGLYSEPDSLRTIFQYKRTGVQVKVTWDVRDYDLICGFFRCGQEPLGGETEIFRGLIDDVTTSGNISDQNLTFTVLGFESLLDQIATPFSSFANGDLISDILYASLNQAPFNELVSVLPENINPSNDVPANDISSLENTVVSDISSSLLIVANSVLYIRENTVYVGPRTPSATIKHSFYGQASIIGIEDVLDIPNYKDGMSRLFNYWTWTDTNYLAFDSTSTGKYGIRKKEIKFDIITNATSIQSALNANRDEFSFPKIEFEIDTPFSYRTLALDILDKINIDYPTVYSPYDSNPLPRYGQNFYGQARYPYGQWSLTINPDQNFKILGKKLDPAKQTITFSVREV